MNKRVFRTVVREFKLPAEDAVSLQKLVIEYDAASSAEEFDRTHADLDATSVVCRAFRKYRVVTSFPNRFVLLMHAIVYRIQMVLAFLRRREFKEAFAQPVKITRDVFTILVTNTRYGTELHMRLLCMEVGVISGHVSDPDRMYASANNLRPLTRLERWLMGDVIDVERSRRRASFAVALGELD